MVRGAARGRDRAAGLTLVELMITVVVAGLVSSAVYVFFVGQQRLYQTQAKLLGVQQNLWGVVETVARYVRIAGNGMTDCVRPDPDGTGPDLGDAPPGGATLPAAGLRAYRPGTGVTRIPPLWIRNGAAGAPDELTVAFAEGDFGTLVASVLDESLLSNTPTAPIKLPGANAGIFRPGELAVLFDVGEPPSSANGDRGCTLFEVTSVDSVNGFVYRDATSPWNPPSNVTGLQPWSLSGGSTATGAVRHLGRLRWIRLAVNRAVDPPVLTMTDLLGDGSSEVLAEGVEDLQIAYACDFLPAGGPDGVLTEGDTPANRNADEWIFNQPGDAIVSQCVRPLAVRISVSVRSLGGEDVGQGAAARGRPVFEDGAAGVTDQFRHRSLVTTIYPRN